MQEGLGRKRETRLPLLVLILFLAQLLLLVAVMVEQIHQILTEEPEVLVGVAVLTQTELEALEIRL